MIFEIRMKLNKFIADLQKHRSRRNNAFRYGKCKGSLSPTFVFSWPDLSSGVPKPESLGSNVLQMGLAQSLVKNEVFDNPYVLISALQARVARLEATLEQLKVQNSEKT